MGRSMGFSAVAVEEIAIGKSREEIKSARPDEAERSLPKHVPDSLHVVLLDAKGKGMTSEDFAEMMGALRDAGTKRDLASLSLAGRTDSPRCRTSGRAAASLSGPQTWPICSSRALLAEQIYRALTILAGHSIPSRARAHNITQLPKLRYNRR